MRFVTPEAEETATQKSAASVVAAVIEARLWDISDLVALIKARGVKLRHYLRACSLGGWGQDSEQP